MLRVRLDRSVVGQRSVTNEVSRDDSSLGLQGIAAYARYQLTPPIAFGVRYERLDDEGLFGGVEQLLQETTLTAEYKFAEGFLVRGEFRRDWSNEPFFPGRFWWQRSSATPEHRAPCRHLGDRQQAGCVVTAMQDLLFIALSLLCFVAGAAYIAGCRRLG